MRERPILMSAPMVRATLREVDPKTQTRRVVGELPYPFSEPEFDDGNAIEWMTTVRAGEDAPDPDAVMPPGWFLHNEDSEDDGCHPIRCPYGQPGDRHWVRESWCPGLPGVTTLAGKTYGVRPFPKSWPIPKTRPEGLVVKYAASWEDDGPPPMRPSIHMPRWASRITLEVTEVRVQRLQDISEEDARAEGLIQAPTPDLRIGWGLPGWHKDQFAPTARQAFRTLWDSINGQRPGCAWASNPWVWAISYKRVEVKP